MTEADSLLYERPSGDNVPDERHPANGAAEDLAGFVNRIVRDGIVTDNDSDEEKGVKISDAARNTKDESNLPAIDRSARRDFLKSADSCLMNMKRVVDVELICDDGDGDADTLFIARRKYLKALALAVKRTVVFALDKEPIDFIGKMVEGASSSNDAIVAMLSKTPYSEFAANPKFVETVKSMASNVREAADLVEAHYFPCLKHFQSIVDDFRSGKRPIEDAQYFVREMLMSIYLFVIHGHEGKDQWSSDARYAVSDANVRGFVNAILRKNCSVGSFNMFLPGNTMEDIKAIEIKYVNDGNAEFSVDLRLRGNVNPELKARFDRLHDEPAQFYKRPLSGGNGFKVDAPVS